AQLPQQLATHRLLVGIVDIASGGEVLAITVTVNAAHGDAALQVVGDGTANRAFELEQAVVAGRQARIAIELVAGLAGDHVDRTPGRVAPVERALRAAQHLDALDVEQRAELRRGLTGD